ncbi:MAG: TIGR00159 family protein [Dehalococcoidia bacterium]|nr:TIGR00159 family protein [Dehalococcoidia bacterium]
MPGIPQGVQDVVARLDFSAVVDILLISISIYWVLLLIRGTTAMTVLRGAAVIFTGAFLLSRALDLQVLSWVLQNSVAGLVLSMAVVFQPEIRRGLERIGRTGFRSFLQRPERRHTLDVVVRASMRLARQQHGALIVLERDTGTGEVVDTGVPLDAEVSYELLVNLFVPNSPLHDGAVVIRGNRIVAAGCTLPLSALPLPSEYGMRHRAAIGITESTDAIVVVVSEERGEVSVCSNGRMVFDLDEARLTRQLLRLFDLDLVDSTAERPVAAAEIAQLERRSS